MSGTIPIRSVTVGREHVETNGFHRCSATNPLTILENTLTSSCLTTWIFTVYGCLWGGITIEFNRIHGISEFYHQASPVDLTFYTQKTVDFEGGQAIFSMLGDVYIVLEGGPNVAAQVTRNMTG